jgi:hypothetical protein
LRRDSLRASNEGSIISKDFITLFDQIDLPKEALFTYGMDVLVNVANIFVKNEQW